MSSGPLSIILIGVVALGISDVISFACITNATCEASVIFC